MLISCGAPSEMYLWNIVSASFLVSSLFKKNIYIYKKVPILIFSFINPLLPSLTLSYSKDTNPLPAFLARAFEARDLEEEIDVFPT